MGTDAQRKFLSAFAAKHLPRQDQKVADLLANYYRLATIRKPEHIDFKWVDSLSVPAADAMRQQYQSLLDQETTVSSGGSR